MGDRCMRWGVWGRLTRGRECNERLCRKESTLDSCWHCFSRSHVVVRLEKRDRRDWRVAPWLSGHFLTPPETIVTSHDCCVDSLTCFSNCSTIL